TGYQAVGGRPGAELQLEGAGLGPAEGVRPAAGGRGGPVELPAGPVSAGTPAVRASVGDLQPGLRRGACRVVDLVRDPYGGAVAVGPAGEDVQPVLAGCLGTAYRDVHLEIRQRHGAHLLPVL